MGVVDPSQLSAPERIRADHALDRFDSGSEKLDEWLRSRALSNDRNDASKTYVIAHSSTVIGYYSISTGGIDRTDAPKSFARNMPDPIPVVILGRLAIDREYQRHGLGKALMRDAFRRIVAISEVVAIRGLMVHALDESARAYYLRWGFVQSPTNEFTLCLPTSTIRSIIGEQSMA